VDLDIDESSFTGETLPSRKHTHPQSVVRNDISQLKNVAFMGTFVCSGHGKGVVISIGEHSEFGSVFRMMQTEESPKTPLQKSMSTLGKQLSFYSLCIIGMYCVCVCMPYHHVPQLFSLSLSIYLFFQRA